MKTELTTLAEWKTADRTKYKFRHSLIEDGKNPVAVFEPTAWADDGSYLPVANITGGPDDAMKALFLWSVDEQTVDVGRRKVELADAEKRLAQMRQTAASI